MSKHSSLSAASHALGVSQPSLSTAIKELEKEFHITILIRSRRGVSFTPEGLELLHFARSITAQTYTLHDHFNTISTCANTLNLSIASHHWIAAAEALSNTVNTLPKTALYTISLYEGSSWQVIDYVAKQQCLLGFLLWPDPVPPFLRKALEKNSLELTLLGTVRPYVYVRKGHALSQKNAVAPSMLASYPYASLYTGQSSVHIEDEFFFPFISSRNQLHVTDRMSLLTMLRRTNAYTLCAGIFPNMHSSGLCSLSLNSPVSSISVGVIHLKGLTMTTERCHITDWMKHYFTQYI